MYVTFLLRILDPYGLNLEKTRKKPQEGGSISQQEVGSMLSQLPDIEGGTKRRGHLYK